MSGCAQSADLSGYEPPESLWSLVEVYVPAHEREEVKIMLGESLVEQSLELHGEISLLLDIWRDYRKETEQKEPLFNRLPEPPAVRDRLKQEIKFFVENIREKARENGRNPEDVLSRHNTVVIDYVCDSGRASMSDGSRPSTARSSRDGRETPLCRDSPISDRLSFASSLSDEVELVRDKLSYLKLDEVVQHLRETLEEEITNLSQDILFLQSCLEDEADYRDTSTTAVSQEPSLVELREERSKLEKDLLQKEPRMPKVFPETTKLTDNVLRRKSATAVGSTGTKLHPSPPSNNKPSGSMKGPHQIHSPPVKRPTDNKPRLNRSDSADSTKKLGRIPVGSATHMTIRTGKSVQSATLVKVGSMPVSSGHLDNGECAVEENANHVPCPPSSKAHPVRPTTADRFRKMVMQCRDGPT